MMAITIAYHDNASSDARQRQWQEALQSAFSDLHFVPLDSRQGLTADIALVWKPPAGQLARCRSLKLIISLGQGVDHLLADPDLPQSVPVCRIVDPNMSHALSQWVIAVLLDHLRDGPAYRWQASQRLWAGRTQAETENMPVAVYGLGAIGQMIAQRLAAIGFSVSGWSRSPKQAGGALAGIDCRHGLAGWQQCLQGARAHICILPLTPATDSLFDAAAFKQMPPGSYVINGGRGGSLVEEDLLAAIRSGHIAGAALDVFRTEPLPTDHPFWDEPAISVWPHVAAQTNPQTARDQVVAAITAVLAGQIPANQIDISRGY